MKINPIIKNVLYFPLNLLYKINPQIELSLLFFLKQRRKIHFNNLKTYNEKIQFVKLFYNNPDLPFLVDKYKVRNYIEKKLPEILVPLLWHGDSPKDIPWEKLPPRFVIKVTRGSGLNIICKEKQKLNIKKTTKLLKKWLKYKYIPCYGEWFYNVVSPSIVIEEFLDNGTGSEPEDYKVYCFNGEPYLIRVDTDRFAGHKTNLYTTEWNFLKDVTWGHPNDKPMQKPVNLQKLLEYSKILSSDFPHVRVDFFIINQKIYFGELTFTSGSGFDIINPISFDYQLGKMLDLESVKK